MTEKKVSAEDVINAAFNLANAAISLGTFWYLTPVALVAAFRIWVAPQFHFPALSYPQVVALFGLYTVYRLGTKSYAKAKDTDTDHPPEIIFIYLACRVIALGVFIIWASCQH